jgi:S1-C subfamily serine protease
MKNSFLFFLITLSIILLKNSYVLAQENSELPHSIIHLIRTPHYIGGSCRTDITFTNQREFNLNLGAIVNYKIYSEGEILITLNENCPATTSKGSTSRSIYLNLNVKRGNEYYVVFKGFKLEEVQRSEIKNFEKYTNVVKQEENLDFPINKASIKDIIKKGGKGQGTCFLISSNGYFITNFHCVENCKELTIKGIDGDFTTKYGATIVASDPSNDLVLLKLNNKNLKFENPPFALRSIGVAQAEKVFALGFPTAEAMGEEVKITEGIISAKSGPRGDVSKLQISAAVNPGNSGGPLIDENGNIIGVIYAKSTIAESAGYAIKSSYLETFLKNVDGFEFPTFVNTISNKPLTGKVAELKKYIFIVETN